MLLLCKNNLQIARARSCSDHCDFAPALDLLRQDATHVLAQPLLSVLDKEYLPPSGDKHDYFSFGPYWWPNPSTGDGLPYVRRDGHINPEVGKTNFAAFRELIRDLQTLTLAHFYFGDETYARDAARRLRVWFLDEATRMKPHLEFAQAVPGVCDGRGIGIIDTTPLCLLPELLSLLQASDSWSEADDAALKTWLSEFLDWLLHSSHGLDEARTHNNHGTWYDAQIATLALACGQQQVAYKVLNEVPWKRFASQIEPDGSQPHELARTRSFTYSCFNLTAMFHLAALAAHFEMDLWSWREESGASLQKALEFLAAFAGFDRPWPYPQIDGTDQSLLYDLLHRPPANFNSPAIEVARSKARPHATAWWKTQLMWPAECIA